MVSSSPHVEEGAWHDVSIVFEFVSGAVPTQQANQTQAGKDKHTYSHLIGSLANPSSQGRTKIQ